MPQSSCFDFRLFSHNRNRNYYQPLVLEGIAEEIYADVSFLKRTEDRLIAMFNKPFSHYNQKTKMIFISDLLLSSEAVQNKMLKNQLKLGIANIQAFISEVKSQLANASGFSSEIQNFLLPQTVPITLRR